MTTYKCTTCRAKVNRMPAVECKPCMEKRWASWIEAILAFNPVTLIEEKEERKE